MEKLFRKERRNWNEIKWGKFDPLPSIFYELCARQPNNRWCQSHRHAVTFNLPNCSVPVSCERVGTQCASHTHTRARTACRCVGNEIHNAYAVSNAYMYTNWCRCAWVVGRCQCIGGPLNRIGVAGTIRNSDTFMYYIFLVEWDTL